MGFQVSVIIPVFNAEDYLRQAVDSCLSLAEAGEVILIEDHSADNSLDICNQLARENAKVKLYQHPDGGNQGAGESRNLGLRMAKFDYVAFLDADDLYSPDRFVCTGEILTSRPDIDGVFEAVGIFKKSAEDHRLYGPSRIIPSEKLFHYLLRGTYGHFHTNGLTVRKSLIHRCGGFNRILRLHQDSDLWLKLAFHGKLVAGNLAEPVAFVRRHKGNRIIHADNESKLFYWKAVWDYFKLQEIGVLNRLLIKRKVAGLKALLKKEPFPLAFIKEMFST